MQPPAVIVFRVKDWPTSRPLLEAQQLPGFFEELACYLHAPADLARSMLEEKLPEEPVEAPLATMVMQLLDTVTEVALESFGHEVYDAGPAKQKHFGFHPSATYEQLASRFEKDGFKVLHATELVQRGTENDTVISDSARTRAKSISKQGLGEREGALVEYVRSGGSMPAAGADHGAIAVRLGALLSGRSEQWTEIDGRILDVACAAGDLSGVFVSFAARINAREERGANTFGLLRKELTRRGIAEGRILVALLRCGLTVTSSAHVYLIARSSQLAAMIEAVRGAETSRTDHPKLIAQLLMWTSCVGAPPAAVEAVIAAVEAPATKEALTDELRAHLLTVWGYEGNRAKAARAKGARARTDVSEPEPTVVVPIVVTPVVVASEPEAPRKVRGKVDSAVPLLSSLNQTFSVTSNKALVSLGDVGTDVSLPALLDALNAKTVVAFWGDVPRSVTVRVTGRGLTTQEAEHAFGSHHKYIVAIDSDALELKVATETHLLPVPKGRYGVEVVAVRSPKPGVVPDYVLIVRDEIPTRVSRRSEVPTIPTRL
jgi:hypothetical protein